MATSITTEGKDHGLRSPDLAQVFTTDVAIVEDVDMVPGTENMADAISGHEQIHGDGKKHVTLVPQPSDDAADPLVSSRSPLYKDSTIVLSSLF